jgi:hypothetical protein
MAKQLKFTKKEQERLPELIKEIGTILLKKMDGGVYSPTLEGTMDIPEGNREVVFSIYAQYK